MLLAEVSYSLVVRLTAATPLPVPSHCGVWELEHTYVAIYSTAMANVKLVAAFMSFEMPVRHMA